MFFKLFKEIPMVSLNPNLVESKLEVVLGSAVLISTFVDSASLALFFAALLFYEKPHTD